jgi:acyl-CoA reductase-like NAD-dependent aldehyde dehydrogenase
VASIADRLKSEMAANGAVELFGRQAEAVVKAALAETGGPGRPGSPNKDLVGRSAQVIARAAGVEVPAGTRLLLLEVGRDHPLVWTEQLMPVLPLVRIPDADAAIDFAVQAERGCRHTAMIHSHDVARLSRMAKLMDCSIFVKNGPCFAGLGQGGAGYASFTVASPTGEGVTRARTFTRERRCTLVDAFRII